MLLFRWLILLLLLGAAFCFYAGTGQTRYRRYGLLTLKWTLITAFFCGSVLERIA